jgi:hypothetical protein
MQIQARANDLVVGTHGRGIYILDDLTPLELLAKAKAAPVAFLYPIQDALLFQPNSSRVSGMGSRGFTGQNPDPGPRVSYLLNAVSANTKLSLAIVDAAGTTVRELPVNKQAGLYRMSWDMRVGPPLTGPVDTLALQRAVTPGTGRGVCNSFAYARDVFRYRHSKTINYRGH